MTDSARRPHARPFRAWLAMAVAPIALASYAAIAADKPASAPAARDWPQWGRTAERNMRTAAAQRVPIQFHPGKFKAGTEEIDSATTRHVRWTAKLGSQTYGNPTIASGRVLVGTNNEVPRQKKYTGDRSAVYCFDEKTGAFQWELNVPKLGAGKVSDWEFIGICSSPSIDGDRVYIMSNRCEIVCMDLAGLSNGNQGYTDEGQYQAGPGQKPLKVTPQDADILWIYDLREELGVFPHNVASNSPLLWGDRLYIGTSNGMDWSHTNIPSPKAPAFICLDKTTGKLLGEEMSGISKRMFHASWCSPSLAVVAGQPSVLFGGPDGFLYAFDPQPAPADDELNELKMQYRVDVNPPEYRNDKDGKPIKYATRTGPSEIIGTPVEHNDLIYVTIGQDPEHGEGIGALSCVDPAQPEGKRVRWQFKQINRSMATPSVTDDFVFVADYSGNVYCLDARTGSVHWQHATNSHMWGSTLLAGELLIVGNEDGDLHIFEAKKEKKLLAKTNMLAPIYSSPVVANDTLYVATQTHLYAIGD